MVDFDAPRARRVYDKLGWYTTGCVLDLTLLRRARAVLEDLESRKRDGNLPAALEKFFESPADGPRPRRFNQYIAMQYQAIADVALSPVLGRIAAILAQTSEIRVFNTALVAKAPGSSAAYSTVGWHCDKAYWQTCSSDRMLTAWIPLQDTTEELGTLRLLSGSHGWLTERKLPALLSDKAFLTDNERDLEAQLSLARLEFEPVSVELRLGQMSFHHMLTLHGSGVNRGSETRYALSVHLQDKSNRYQVAYEPDGSPVAYVHDSFVRRLPSGEPDYADPEICPVIWSDSRETPPS